VNWTHPAAALAGAAFVVLLRVWHRRRPLRLDVTIRQPKENDHDVR
jgi:hypothetical protein